MNHIEYIGLLLVLIYNIFTIYYDKKKLMKLIKMLENNLIILKVQLFFSLLIIIGSHEPSNLYFIKL